MHLWKLERRGRNKRSKGPKKTLDKSEKNGSQQTLLAGRAEISRQDPALTLQGYDVGQDHLGELVCQELAGNFGF